MTTAQKKKEKKKVKSETLRGWRLRLFNSMLENGYIKIKNKELKVTKKFMRLVEYELKKVRRVE